MMIDNQPYGNSPIVENASEIRNDFANYIDKVRQGDRYILTLHGRTVAALIGYQDFLDAFYPWKLPAKEE